MCYHYQWSLQTEWLGTTSCAVVATWSCVRQMINNQRACCLLQYWSVYWAVYWHVSLAFKDGGAAHQETAEYRTAAIWPIIFMPRNCQWKAAVYLFFTEVQVHVHVPLDSNLVILNFTHTHVHVSGKKNTSNNVRKASVWFTIYKTDQPCY